MVSDYLTGCYPARTQDFMAACPANRVSSMLDSRRWWFCSYAFAHTLLTVCIVEDDAMSTLSVDMVLFVC